jgi:hypothetical protein
MAKKGRGRSRSIKGGSSECTACSLPTGQTGGKMSGLNPESLSGGDSFDRAGNSLANQAYGEYLNQSNKLASLKGQNAMMGGRSRKRRQRRGKGRSAKKYSRKSRSKSRSKH